MWVESAACDRVGDLVGETLPMLTDSLLGSSSVAWLGNLTRRVRWKRALEEPPGTECMMDGRGGDAADALPKKRKTASEHDSGPARPGAFPPEYQQVGSAGSAFSVLRPVSLCSLISGRARVLLGYAATAQNGVVTCWRAGLGRPASWGRCGYKVSCLCLCRG